MTIETRRGSCYYHPRPTQECTPSQQFRLRQGCSFVDPEHHVYIISLHDSYRSWDVGIWSVSTEGGADCVDEWVRSIGLAGG